MTRDLRCLRLSILSCIYRTICIVIVAHSQIYSISLSLLYACQGKIRFALGPKPTNDDDNDESQHSVRLFFTHRIGFFFYYYYLPYIYNIYIFINTLLLLHHYNVHLQTIEKSSSWRHVFDLNSLHRVENILVIRNANFG